MEISQKSNAVHLRTECSRYRKPSRKKTAKRKEPTQKTKKKTGKGPEGKGGGKAAETRTPKGNKTEKRRETEKQGEKEKPRAGNAEKKGKRENQQLSFLCRPRCHHMTPTRSGEDQQTDLPVMIKRFATPDWVPKDGAKALGRKTGHILA